MQHGARYGIAGRHQAAPALVSLRDHALLMNGRTCLSPGAAGLRTSVREHSPRAPRTESASSNRARLTEVLHSLPVIGGDKARIQN